MYQLGERTVRIRKVVGSNPFRSTIKQKSEAEMLRTSAFFAFPAPK